MGHVHCNKITQKDTGFMVRKGHAQDAIVNATILDA